MSAPGAGGGALVLDVPAPLLRAATWRLCAASGRAAPGAPLALPAGACRAVVALHVLTPQGAAAMRLGVAVHIEPGRTTRLRVPLPEALARWLALFAWPAPEPAAAD